MIAVGRTTKAKRRRVWVPSGLLCGAVWCAFLLSGCSAKKAGEEAPSVAVQVAAAENKPIQSKVVADAVLGPRDQAAIVPEVSTPISKFYVDRGSRVHAGQLLAELESQALAGAAAENAAGLQQAEANYQARLQKADQDLKLAKQELDAAQSLYDNRQSLLKQGAVSQKDVQDAQISLTQAQNEYQAAQKQYDLKQAEAELAAAKARNQSAAAQLSYTRITSPIDGVVTDRPFYAGETPPSGSPILTVMDLATVRARLHVSQAEAAEIKVGSPATISVSGQSPDVRGKVTLVSPALDPNSTTVEVWVEAPNPGSRLKPGSSARVAIVGETAPHAVVIPAAALLTASDGTASVIVLGSGDKPEKRPVTTGIRNDEDVQITEGVKAGERVVTVGAFELSNEDDDILAKTRVQVQAPQNSDAGAGDGPDKGDAKPDDDK